jgi:hypothetical protein
VQNGEAWRLERKRLEKQEMSEKMEKDGPTGAGAHPRATEPSTLIVTLGLSVVGAIIDCRYLIKAMKSHTE